MNKDKENKRTDHYEGKKKGKQATESQRNRRRYESSVRMLIFETVVIKIAVWRSRQEGVILAVLYPKLIQKESHSPQNVAISHIPSKKGIRISSKSSAYSLRNLSTQSEAFPIQSNPASHSSSRLSVPTWHPTQCSYPPIHLHPQTSQSLPTRLHYSPPP